uniref:Uncharacterized protein n=1 Tax=Anguilla anguilla TaxID=7936 RepID=A0A0E9X7S2_ANGAN
MFPCLQIFAAKHSFYTQWLYLLYLTGFNLFVTLFYFAKINSVGKVDETKIMLSNTNLI